MEFHHFLVSFASFIGSLDWYSSGDQFLCGVAVLGFAGETWAAALVLDIFNLLCNGRGVCEKKCGGNQREITSRN